MKKELKEINELIEESKAMSDDWLSNSEQDQIDFQIKSNAKILEALVLQDERINAIEKRIEKLT